MAFSTGQGVAAVTLPTFSTSGDPRRNCEKFIQMFKDWGDLNGWYDREPLPPPAEKKERNQYMSGQCGLLKARLWQLSAQPSLATKKSETSCGYFSFQTKSERNRM